MGEEHGNFDQLFNGYEQVRELQLQNQELLAEIDSKDEEISQLRELADAAAELSASDARAQKIVQLSKKNRSLNLALEKERALSLQLAQELRSAKADAAAKSGNADPKAAEDAARQIVQEAAEAAEAMRREAAEWREKHRQASDRQIQAEAKAGIAAREADKLRRLLQREIGDGADLAKVMEEGSNWRGRAQQIVLLKHRLQEAQAGEAAPGTVARPREDGNRRALDELKEKRRQEADKAEAELAEARGELEKLRFKCDAAVSRKKLLEDEVKNLKEKIAVLLSKTTNDDKLIAALRSQLEQSKRAPHETNPRVKAKPGNTTDGKGADVLKEELMRKEEQIERQLMIIHTLEAQIGDR